MMTLSVTQTQRRDLMKTFDRFVLAADHHTDLVQLTGRCGKWLWAAAVAAHVVVRIAMACL
jgi:hypothetical protein